jgi:hypothetical protein
MCIIIQTLSAQPCRTLLTRDSWKKERQGSTKRIWAPRAPFPLRRSECSWSHSKVDTRTSNQSSENKRAREPNQRKRKPSTSSHTSARVQITTTTTSFVHCLRMPKRTCRRDPHLPPNLSRTTSADRKCRKTRIQVPACSENTATTSGLYIIHYHHVLVRRMYISSNPNEWNL